VGDTCPGFAAGGRQATVGIVSDATEPTASSGATPWLAAGALACAAGLTIYAFTRPSSKPAAAVECPPAQPFVWQEDPGWLNAWDRAAAGSRGVVTRDLDAWTQRWLAARGEACERPPGVREATLTCLERQAARARSLAEVLPTLDAEHQPAAWAAGLGLPSTEDCGVAQSPRPAPRDPAAQQTVDRAHALLDAGRPLEAGTAVQTRELGEDDPLRARARWIEGHALPVDQAYTHWQRALGDAIAADDPALATTIALGLSTTTPADEGLSAAQRWWALASAHARRLPTTATRQHALLATQATMLARHGKADAALSLHEPALALLESSLGSTHPALVPGLRASCVAAAARGKLDAAERLAKRALELADDSLGARHPEALATLDAIAGALRDAGAPEKATAWIRMGIERRPEAEHGEHLVGLGEAYLQSGRIGDAAESFARALTWSEHHDAKDLTLRIALGRAAVAQARGDADTAAEHLQSALDGPLDASARNTVRLRRVAVLLDAERYDDASAAATVALEAVDNDATDDATRGEALSVAADVALRSGNADAAIAFSRRAVARLVRAHGTDHPAVLLALTHLGTACLSENRNEDAAAAFARAVQIARAAPAEVRVAAALGWATALWRTGAKTEAATVVREVHATVAHDARPGAAADAAAWLAQRDLPLEAETTDE